MCMVYMSMLNIFPFSVTDVVTHKLSSSVFKKRNILTYFF